MVMQINIWFFVASIVGALVFGAAGATVFIKKDATSANTKIIEHECKPVQKETFRRGGELKDTGKGKEY